MILFFCYLIVYVSPHLILHLLTVHTLHIRGTSLLFVVDPLPLVCFPYRLL